MGRTAERDEVLQAALEVKAAPEKVQVGSIPSLQRLRIPRQLGLPKAPSKTPKFHLQIVENRLEFQSKISPPRAAVGK